LGQQGLHHYSGDQRRQRRTRYGLFGDVAPVKDDPEHTWKVYALDKLTGQDSLGADRL